MNTPTPRTDAAIVEAYGGHEFVKPTGNKFVPADFARLLERELAEAREGLKQGATKIEQLYKDLKSMQDGAMQTGMSIQRLIHDLAAWRKVAQGAKPYVEQMAAFVSPNGMSAGMISEWLAEYNRKLGFYSERRKE